MRARQGMFLIEVLITLMLFSFLSVLIMRFIATSTWTMLSMNKHNDQIVAVTSAVDWLMRDMESLTSSEQLVKDGKNDLKIVQESERITWKLHTDRLLRISQSYDKQRGRWKKPYTCEVAGNIQEFVWHIIYKKDFENKQHLAGITCTISGYKDDKIPLRVTQVIALRNGLA